MPTFQLSLFSSSREDFTSLSKASSSSLASIAASILIVHSVVVSRLATSSISSAVSLMSPKASSISAWIASWWRFHSAVPTAASPATTPPMIIPFGPRVPRTFPSAPIESVALPPDCTSLPMSLTAPPMPLVSFPIPVVAVPTIFRAGPAAAAIPAMLIAVCLVSSSRSPKDFIILVAPWIMGVIVGSNSCPNATPNSLALSCMVRKLFAVPSAVLA